MTVACAGILAPTGGAAAPDPLEASAQAAGIGRPAAVSPRDGAPVAAVPAFSWRAVRKAARYEFQLSADNAFRSIVDNGSFETLNTFATVDKTLADGNYYWRARAIDSRARAGRWSAPRSVAKRWTTRPTLLGPSNGSSIGYPGTPLVLRWEPVPYAYKYLVSVGTDPSLATPLVASGGRPIETQGTAFAVPEVLAPGTQYYWAVTPIDAAGHRGATSAVSSFVFGWDSSTSPQVADVNSAEEVYDPRMSWTTVPGAAAYEVEVGTSPEFAVGSKVCCSDRVTGTSLTPKRLLPNNTGNDPANAGYHWRVRAINVNGKPGAWNTGPSFQKTFDATDPSIKQLRVRDATGDPLSPADPPTDLDPATAHLDTSSPIVTWAPVPGASSYHVRVVPWGALGCEWSTDGQDSWGVTAALATASNSWAPFASHQASPVDTGSPPLAVQSENKRLLDGHGYCARITARGGTDTAGERVIGKSIELGSLSAPAFEYRASITPPSGTPVTMSASDYHEPAQGSTVSRMPLFTWEAKSGVCAYFVIVARDQAFTNVVDVARTTQPSYAPRLRTYPDETTDLYWVVLPVQQDPDSPASCGVVPTTWSQNSPRSFRKRSNPPGQLAPAEGQQLASQPTFHWTGAEAARDYRLQVSRDPNFQDGRLLLDDVTTAATSYTSSSTYPADAKVYWRVRANDENGLGLTWSPTRTFRRSLPAPRPGTGNPTGGEFLPVFSWPSVPGAVSYGLHVQQADGTVRNFTIRSAAFTPVLFYGTGVWHWQVRANFPGAGNATVPGPYSARRAFTRYIGRPTGARSTSTARRLLVSWDPSRTARKYRVEFSETNSFSRKIESKTVENTSHAPRLTQRGFLDGGPIYWRVAAVDEGNNVGGWSTGQVKLLSRLVIKVRGRLAGGRRGLVSVSVRDARGRAVRGARVTPRGAGVRIRSRRTGRRGTVRLRLRPRTKGTVRFRVDRSGYRPGSATLRVR